MTAGYVTILAPGHDLFWSGAEALVDPVDCTGAQGAGLALEFARRFPAQCRDFKRAASLGGVTPGSVSVARAREGSWVLFVATKKHWREPSRIEYVATACANLRREVTACGARSVAIPALGCGLGELAWDDVRPLLQKAGEEMAEAGARVSIYAPHEAPAPRRRRR